MKNKNILKYLGKISFKSLFKTFGSQIVIGGIIILIMAGSVSFTVYTKNHSKNDQSEVFLVQFESNGGNAINSQYLKKGSVVVKPNNPEKVGFSFKYWELFDSEYDFNSTVSSNIILKAVYAAKSGTEIVKVSFDTSTANKIDDIEIIKGGVVAKPIDPTLSGYKFVGWYKNYEKFDFSTKITENIILKAKWELKSESNVEVNTSNKYKCAASFRSDVPEKNVTVGYSDHVNWTWSTYGTLSTYECYITYKTSDSSIATVNDSGKITAIKSGTAYVSSCANDVETKKEVICFTGKLNIQDVNDTTTVLSKYDETVNEYAGIWYLEGHSDAYIKIAKYKYYYEAMDILPMNIDIMNGGIYPNGYRGIQISYENWNSDLAKYNVTLGTNFISIKTPVATYKFTKIKGTENKYSNSKFYEAIGTWYLFNKPEANFEIYKSGDDTDPTQNVSYCITPNSFNFTTLDYINGRGGHLGCGSATNNEILEDNGITILNGEMTVKNSNGSVKLYQTIKTVSVTSISLNKSSMSLFVGNSENLSSTIYPNNAYNQSTAWTSSNSSIATVDNSGKVTAISEGIVTITVTTSDGNKVATCVVSVSKINVTDITLNKINLSLIKGGTSVLTATILPSNATDSSYSWSSSNPSVVTVDKFGKVTAISKGVATITVTTNDGNKTANCEVVVNNPALLATSSVGMSTIFTSELILRGISVTIKPTGGTGTYIYYYIKLYKSGVLIKQTSDTSSNTLFASGYTNGSYYVEYEVRDSDGTVYTNTSGTTTISGF